MDSKCDNQTNHNNEDSKMNISEFLDDQYSKLTETKYDRCQIYGNLIAVKKFKNMEGYKYSLYVDVKNWINCSFIDKEYGDFGYDVVPIDKFIECITTFPVQQQVGLYKYLYHKAQYHGNSTGKIERNLLKARLDKFKMSKDYLNYILLYIGTNTKVFLITLLIIFILATLILLPAPTKSMVIFEANIKEYSPIQFLTYVCNSFAWIIGIEPGSDVLVPINPRGLIIYAIIKVFLIGIIGNYLFQKIAEFIDSVKTDE